MRLLCVLVLVAGVTRGAEAQTPEKWFYAYVDLLNDDYRPDDEVNFGTQEFIGLLPRLKSAGYGVVVLSNYYLGHIERLEGKHQDSQRYLTNLKRVRSAAEERDIEIIPEVMAVGASGQLLVNNPHLAEGAPVADCELVVVEQNRGDLIASLKDTANAIQFGDFNGSRDQITQAFKPQPNTFELSLDSMSNNQSLLFEDASGGIFLEQKSVPLKARHQYEWSFRLRTEDLTGENGRSPHLYSVVSVEDAQYGDRKLHRVNHSVNESDGAWKTYVVSLNSFGYTSAKVSIGIENVASGKVWIDNVSLRQAWAVNLLRRNDLPVVVRRQDGSVLTENDDYVVELNPEMGKDGHYFQEDAAGPLKIVPNRGVKKGETLLASYYHAQLPDSAAHRVCCSLTHPDVMILHARQVELLDLLLTPKRWLINHDEIRAAGHEPTAISETPGTLLRRHLIECLKVIKTNGGNKPVVLMNDMYDPHHNAVGQSHAASYYPMVNGSFSGSWLPITDTDVSDPPATTIWNWSLGDGDPDQLQQEVSSSYAHFRDLGYPQVVAGYYDIPPHKAGPYTKAQFDMAKQHAGAVDAVCYYTAKRSLCHLEQFSATADAVWPAK